MLLEKRFGIHNTRQHMVRRKISHDTAKSFFVVFTLFLFFSNASLAAGEKLAFVGYNTSTPDSISFVAIEPFAAGEKIYFTDNEFLTTGTFNDAGEGTAFYTVPAGGLAAGAVVILQETGVSTNTFGVTCSFATGANCGSATVVDRSAEDSSANANVSYSGSDAIFAYRDTDDNPANGVSGVYAAISRDAFSAIMGNNSPVDWAANPESPVVVEGFASDVTHRDFKNALRTNTTVGQFISPSNFDTGTTYQALDPTPITFSSGTNPELSITLSPSSVAEDSGTNLVYNFSLTPAPTNPVTINFSVDGSAVLNTDYTASSASTFTFGASSGTIVVPSSGSATLNVTPVADSTVEPFDSVSISGTPASGYDLGASNSAIGTIANDDTDDSPPLVAITGLNHATPDGFSFVALTTITGSETIYFTDKEFNNTSLLFNTSEGAVRWIAPAAGVAQGDVIVASERASPNNNTFDVTCTGGSGTTTCGTVSLSNGTSFSISGEEFYAYSDNNTNPEDGVTQVHAVINTRGPVIPFAEDPSTIWGRAVVVSNFDSVFPGITTENRVEYKFASGERAVAIDRTIFSNINNWLYGEPAQVASSVRFTNINIGQGPPTSRLSVGVSQPGTLEDSGVALSYTFTLDGPAAADLPINFTTGGTATGADYVLSNTSPVTILSGQNSVSITVTPIADTTLEPDESVTVSIAPGMDYEAGTVSSVTANIINEDIGTSAPLVAVIGVNAITADGDGFAFVALDDIPASATVFFTDRPFERSSISFPGTGDGVFKWTAPAGVTRGEVFVIKESSTANVIGTLSCTDGTGATCGTATLEAGTISLSNSEPIHAYSDTDSEPHNGLTEVYSLTYPSANNGGMLLDSQNPRFIFPNVIIVDQLALTTSSRYEYDPMKRTSVATQADIENTTSPSAPGNWVISETAGSSLSTVKFDNVALGNLVNLSTSSPTSSEAAGTEITVTVTADQAVVGNQTLDLSVSGTNVTASDFILSASSITILDGQTVGTATFTVLDDAVVEALTEIAALTISNPSSGIQIGATATADVGITDNDRATLSINDISITENNSGMTQADFTITLSAPVDIAISMAAATADDTATVSDGDYAAITAGSITFPANSSTNATQTLSVNVTGDQTVELNESLLVNLSNIVANSRDVTFADSQGMLTVNNDDSATVSINDVIASEGNSGNTSFDFTVSLSAQVDTAVSMNTATNDGTATSADNDFSTVTMGTISFMPNSMANATQTLSITVNGDGKVELDEAFSVILSNISAAGRNVTFADSEADAQINNDDAATLSINDVTASEGDTATRDFIFTVTLDSAVDAAVAVDFASTEGSALISDSDFAGASGNIEFAANSTAGATQTINVTVNGDTKLEPNEDFLIDLSNLSAGGRSVSMSKGQAVGTITNDDSATVTLSPVLAVQAEGNTIGSTTPFTFSVALDNAVQDGFEIAFLTNDGSATLVDNDYQDNDDSLTFEGVAGEAQIITVGINHDDNVEVDETFEVTLGSISGLAAGVDAHAISGTTAPVIATISNDDFDRDFDDVLDRNDNCPDTPNSDQANSDGDNLGDACDDDLDGDGLDNTLDNCPAISNADQADLDLDGLGNVCDNDIDGDGMPNDYETANGLNPFSSFDQRADPDRDGFTNIEEFEFGTDPNVPDLDENNNDIPDSVDRRRAIAPTIVPSIILPLLLDDAA